MSTGIAVSSPPSATGLAVGRTEGMSDCTSDGVRLGTFVGMEEGDVVGDKFAMSTNCKLKKGYSNLNGFFKLLSSTPSSFNCSSTFSEIRKMISRSRIGPFRNTESSMKTL